MNIRSLMVVLGATAGLVFASACVVKEGDGSTGGNGGDGGEGGTTTTSTSTTTTATGTGGAGGAGGAAACIGCGEYLTDDTGAALCTASEDIYKAFTDCVCGDTACGAGSAGKECEDSCTMAGTEPSAACAECANKVGQAGAACNAQFSACANDVPN